MIRVILRSDVTGLGKTSTRVLTANEANLVRAPAVSRPVLGLRTR